MLIPITIVIPIFNDVLILDKGENVINNGKHVLFHILKCSDKLCWYNSNIVDIIQIQNERFHSSSGSLVFAMISEFWFSGFSGLTIELASSTVKIFRGSKISYNKFVR